VTLYQSVEDVWRLAEWAALGVKLGRFSLSFPIWAPQRLR
jgi:hypothetical protein